MGDAQGFQEQQIECIDVVLTQVAVELVPKVPLGLWVAAVTPDFGEEMCWVPFLVKRFLKDGSVSGGATQGFALQGPQQGSCRVSASTVPIVQALPPFTH